MIHLIGNKFSSSALWSYALILLMTACIDRVYINVDKPSSQAISVSGFISDQPGPYEVRIYNVFDIESKETLKTPVTVKHMELSDNTGNVQAFHEVNPGIYQTDSSGIRGVLGGIYKLKIELLDGRMYESVPDTIFPVGSLDSLYLAFREKYNVAGEKEYSFDVYFDTSYDEKTGTRFAWKFEATFKADTHPERHLPTVCFFLDEISRCNYLPPCSGFRNIGTNLKPIFEKQFPCTCCQCWYSIFNDSIMVSDDLFTNHAQLKGIRAQNIPLNQWTLFYKIRLDVSQRSLSSHAHEFWKALGDQQSAIGSLFQPVTGKIPLNFIQVSGEPVSIEGLFYATAISSKVRYLDQFDLPPDLVYQIPLEKPEFDDDCRMLFPHSTNEKPNFWIE